MFVFCQRKPLECFSPFGDEHNNITTKKSGDVFLSDQIQTIKWSMNSHTRPLAGEIEKMAKKASLMFVQMDRIDFISVTAKYTHLTLIRASGNI